MNWKDKFIIKIQKRYYDCGVAASYMLLANAGKKIGYKRLEEKLRLTREGVSCSAIGRYFRALTSLKPGVKKNAKITDIEKALEKGRLCMVVYQSWGKRHEQKSLECGHYSVVVKITKNKIYMLDPGAYEDWGHGIGWRIMGKQYFERMWIDKDFGRVIKRWMLSVKPLPLAKNI